MIGRQLTGPARRREIHSTIRGFRQKHGHEMASDNARMDTIRVGIGPAGVTSGGECKRRDRQVFILQRKPRAEDRWRRRRDSLEMSTAVRNASLPGLPFPP
jgi:cation diffusion facilitator CzcD-associated flavoprotein CzcO